MIDERDAHPAGMVVMRRVTDPPYMCGNMRLIVVCLPACNDATGAGSIVSGHDVSPRLFGGHAKSHPTSSALNGLNTNERTKLNQINTNQTNMSTFIASESSVVP